LREVEPRLVDQDRAQREVDRDRAERDDQDDQRGIDRRDPRAQRVQWRWFIP
jgi:hypothetical protein